MEQDIVQGGSPWRNLNDSSGPTALKGAQTGPGQISSQQTPPEELFNPDQRKKLLQHLVDIQFPAIREIVARIVESGFFLLDPGAVTLSVIRKVTLEADEYNKNNPYWDWLRSVASVAVHEIVMATEEDEISEESSETSSLIGEALRNKRMRKHFNGLPLEQRRALYFIAVVGMSIEDAARSVGEEAEELKKHAREGLRRVLREIESEERGDGNAK